MKRFSQFVCVLLIIAMCFAIPVAAEEIAPYASNYFLGRSGYLWGTSSTSFQVWFEVTAVSTMTKLGVNYIDIERSSDGVNWSVVKTYTKEAYSNLVASNTVDHSGYVTYSEVASGYQYRAYIDFYAKNSSGTAYYGYYAYYA